MVRLLAATIYSVYHLQFTQHSESNVCSFGNTLNSHTNTVSPPLCLFSKWRTIRAPSLALLPSKFFQVFNMRRRLASRREGHIFVNFVMILVDTSNAYVSTQVCP